jgi:hypothetical protein
MDDLNKDELMEAFDYLDELRETGETNMFGAASYIISDLGWHRDAARAATLAWMETFDGFSTPKERAKRFLDKNK